jgi:hypothetical protein
VVKNQPGFDQNPLKSKSSLFVSELSSMKLPRKLYRGRQTVAVSIANNSPRAQREAKSAALEDPFTFYKSASNQAAQWGVRMAKE